VKVLVYVSGHRSGDSIAVPLALKDGHIEFEVPGQKRSAKCSFDLSFPELHEALVHLEDAALKGKLETDESEPHTPRPRRATADPATGQTSPKGSSE
jgi:hypothetical protein